MNYEYSPRRVMCASDHGVKNTAKKKVMIKIEFEEPNIETCDCCGKETVKLTRFVYKDDDAFAIYYIKFTKGHEEKVVAGIVCIGGLMTNPKIDFHFLSKFGQKIIIIRSA